MSLNDEDIEKIRTIVKSELKNCFPRWLPTLVVIVLILAIVVQIVCFCIYSGAIQEKDQWFSFGEHALNVVVLAGLLAYVCRLSFNRHLD